MAFSYVLYTGNGTLKDYAFSFPYLDPAHIQVSVNGVSAPYTYLSANTIRITTAPPNGQVIEIKRVTVSATAPVDFVDGSVLKEVDLDRLVLYSTYAAQESLDAQARTIFQKANGAFTASSRYISDVADPVLPQDVATKNYIDITFTASMDAKAAAAAASASAASTSAGQASTSATNAGASAGAANTSAVNANVSAGQASTSASAALTSKNSAGTSETNAATSASAAATSASNAAASASTATTQASSASGSASSASSSSGAASTSATNAGNSASAASGSAATATTQASNASSSATASANSASAAAASAASVVQSNLVHIAGTETITGAKTFSADVKIPSINGGPLSGFRNRLMNGAFVLNSRAAGAVIATGSFPADRWCLRSNGLGTLTTAATITPSSGITLGSQQMLQLYASTAQATMGANDYAFISQSIEGINIADLGWGTATAKPITVSFICYGTSVGVMSVSVRNGIGNMSYVVPVTLTTGSTARFSITIPGPTTGTWDQGTSRGIELSFCFTANPTTGTYSTPNASVWQAGNYVSHSTQSNWASVINKYFLIGDVQLETGPVATPFEIRETGLELAMCRRYYEKMTIGFIGASPYAAAYVGNIQSWSVGKRIVPTLVLETPTDNVNSATLAFVAMGTSSIRIWATPASVGNAFYTNIVAADSEM